LRSAPAEIAGLEGQVIRNQENVAAFEHQ
jgi:hypothetical protein